MDEGDGVATLAYGGGDAVDVAGADVTDRKDRGSARFERVRRAGLQTLGAHEVFRVKIRASRSRCRRARWEKLHQQIGALERRERRLYAQAVEADRERDGTRSAHARGGSVVTTLAVGRHD
jgi:hypothetical protein